MHKINYILKFLIKSLFEKPFSCYLQSHSTQVKYFCPLMWYLPAWVSKENRDKKWGSRNFNSIWN